jgi:hypothetical protein
MESFAFMFSIVSFCLVIYLRSEVEDLKKKIYGLSKDNDLKANSQESKES